MIVIFIYLTKRYCFFVFFVVVVVVVSFFSFLFLFSFSVLWFWELTFNLKVPLRALPFVTRTHFWLWDNSSCFFDEMADHYASGEDILILISFILFCLRLS